MSLAPALKAALEKKAGDKERESSPPSGKRGLILELADGEVVDTAVRRLGALLSEVDALFAEGKWDEIIDLIHPVHEKYPFLTELGIDGELRQKAAFALGRRGRVEEALAVLEKAIEAEPDSYKLNYASGYAAYDALYRDRNRELTLAPARRRELIDLALRRFGRCIELDKGRVTPCYRMGMLYKEFLDRPKKAAMYLGQAVKNWDALDKAEQERRHQERPKFIRSLYHMASCLLKTGEVTRARMIMERLLQEDEGTGFISTVFKHYAMGKVLFAGLDFKGALEHLSVAVAASGDQGTPDFVRDLRAAVLLRLGRAKESLSEIRRVPERMRRPYIRWREAEILLALDRPEEALLVLETALARDPRSKHKTMLRMSAILYSLGRYRDALAVADQACHFHRKRFGTECREGLFRKGVALAAVGSVEEAAAIFDDLSAQGFHYPGFSAVRQRVKEWLQSKSRIGSKRLEVVKC